MVPRTFNRYMLVNGSSLKVSFSDAISNKIRGDF